MLTRRIKGSIGRLVGLTPIALFPVRVRKGPAKGARWTLVPFSANWRRGGSENDVNAALQKFGECRDRVFWDMGAHFGIHTVGFAFLAGSSGQVVAFEPDRRAFSRLSRHVRMNKLENVRLFQAAASDGYRKDRLYHSGGSSNAHLKYNSWDSMPENIESQEILTIAVDEVVAQENLRLPDFIKIDVQGHGGRAIKGCRRAVAASLPLIVFSNHSRTEQQEISAVLRPLGYVPENLGGTRLEWEAPFNEVIFIPPNFSAH